MLFERWNLDGPLSMTRPPVEHREFVRAKRVEFLRLCLVASFTGVAAVVPAVACRGEFEEALPAVQAYTLMIFFWYGLAWALPASGSDREAEHSVARK